MAGCAMDVLNTLGHGELEKPCENARVMEFGLHGIPFRQQPRYSVEYKSAKVGEYVSDLIFFCLDQYPETRAYHPFVKFR